MSGLEQLCLAVYAQAVAQGNPGYAPAQIVREPYFWGQWNEDEQRIVYGRVPGDVPPPPERMAGAAPSVDLSFTHEPMTLR